MAEMEFPRVLRLAVEGQASPSLCTSRHQDAGEVSVEAEGGKVNRLLTAQASPSLRRDILAQQRHFSGIALSFS